MIYPTVKRWHGVSLIELMIVLAIFGIMIGVAAPDFGKFIAERRLSTETRRVIGALTVARSEARARGATVTVSRGDDGWNDTLEIYEDVTYSSLPGANNEFVPAQDDRIKRVSGVSRSIATDDNQGAADMWVAFNLRGWLNESSPVVIALCAPGLPVVDGIYIEINRVGKIRERKIDSDDVGGCTP